MAEALAKKKRVRGGHRSSATRLIQQVNEAVAAGEGEAAAETDVARLRQLKLSLEEKLRTLTRMDEEIVDLVEDEAIPDEIEQADIFKERIYAATLLIGRHCGPNSRRSTPPADVDVDREASHSHGAHVRLPKLAIHPFNGDITNWTTFWDSFESAINSNPGLTAIDKFNYLKSLLEKSAAEAVSGLMLTADNYKEAISILKKRFGNKRQIVSKHMDILL